ncbi:MAG TPA: 50S ribosomal protein L11 methyltransferase [Myxococcales bacterium LLY-WYZ-16_1]|nr:50S ribosomal protein L11 methyltransferase [Myxococcales bacterium LLY-WYZ-16_1]
MAEGAPALSDLRPVHAAIRAHTEVVRPFGVPELALHAITHRCPLWRGDSQTLRALGWPEPYWAFVWAGGQALARHLLDHPKIVRGKALLDVGAGSGIVGLAARLAGAARVLASDVDPVAVEAIRLNAALNDLGEIEASSVDRVDRPADGFDVVTLGDVTYDPELGRRIGAWARRLAAEGVDVWVGDPDRGFLDLEGFETVAVVEAGSDLDDTGQHRVATRILRLKR